MTHLNESPRTPAAVSSTPLYPFTAIVGQDEMKLALVLNAVDPGIGGVMIMGHRGTGKSTAVRALAEVLPPLIAVPDCPLTCPPERPGGLCARCDGTLGTGNGHLSSASVPTPLVTLPLGATEDRVTGTLDIEAALARGVKRFEPGLLARANNGFLYIDEVNLLEDYLVDLLLDVAASGVNVVEREGISVSHPARFVLVGSGNPEEGDLRPQLLDRFGLHAQIETIRSLDERIEIVRRRDRFQRDPATFAGEWAGAEQTLRQRIVQARAATEDVELPDDVLRRAALLCMDLGIDGHRGEITIARAARACAALDGRPVVTNADVRRVAQMALRHRLRRDPMDQIDSGERIAEAMNRVPWDS